MLNYLFTHTPLLYFVQSFWRDEAFSVLAAEKPLVFIVSKLGFEPPVYYTLLHFWIRVFGESDLAIRSLSLLGFLFATFIVIEWADELYRKHWLSVFLPVFFFLNPMLLYYAFEVRTYAWYTFFATAMLYGYTTKRWKWFIGAAILGFYTHVYLLPFIGALFLHTLLTERIPLRHFFRKIFANDALRSFFIVGVAIIPWLVKIVSELPRLKDSWYFPVNMQLVLAALGNMYTGYEGTPWYGWKYATMLSFAIVVLTALALTDKTHRKRTMEFVVFGGLPLVAIIGLSFIKPLYVNRYLIPTTIAEVLVITAAIAAIKNRSVQAIAAAVILTATLWFNWWFPPQHPKVPVRNTMIQINMLVKPSDVVLAKNPLIFLETLYYAKDRTRLYLYNPGHVTVPWYIGDALIPDSQMTDRYPTYPGRAFLVDSDGSFEIVYQIPLGAGKPPKK